MAALENHAIFIEIAELYIQRDDENAFEHKIESKLKTYIANE